VQCGPAGLFPLPVNSSAAASLREKFSFIGRLVAKALLDQRYLDLPLSQTFLKAVMGQNLGVADFVSLSETFGRSLLSLQQLCAAKRKLQANRLLNEQEVATQIANLRLADCKIEDLSLDFTMPGHHDWELKPGGKEINVTIQNLEEYVDLVCDHFLRRGIQTQVESFRAGFSQLLPLDNIKSLFSLSELEQLICGGTETSTDQFWTLEVLQEALACDHGFSHQSRAVRHLLEVMVSLSGAERRQFLQFVTGSPRLPIGGFKALNPRLTIVRKEHPSGQADRYLPSVMTCANYLKLPDYSSKEILRERLFLAIQEGQASFHLS